MDDISNRSPFRTRAELRSAPIDPPSERVRVPEDLPTSEDLRPEANSTPEAPEAPAAASRRRKQLPPVNEFSGSLIPAQFKLPSDLVQSLKLHAIDTGENMSEIVLRCLTGPDTIAKAWISTRKSA